MKLLNRLIVSTVAGVATLSILFALIDVNLLVNNLTRASPQWLGAFVVVSAVFYLVRAVRWRILLKPAAHSIRLSSTFWSTTVGYLVNTALPLRVVGEAARAVTVGSRERIGVATPLASVGLERLLDLLSIAILGLAGAGLGSFTGSVPSWLTTTLGIAAAGTTTATLLLVVGSKRERITLSIISRIVSIIPIGGRGRRTMTGLAADLMLGLRTLGGGRGNLVSLSLLSMAVWLLQVAASYAALTAFGIGIGLPALLIGSMMVQLSFILPAPPGFAGTYEAYFIFVYSALGIAFVDLLTAAAVVSHLLSVLLITVLGWAGASVMGTSLRGLILVSGRARNLSSGPR